MVKPLGGDGFDGLFVDTRFDSLVLEGAFVTVIESVRGKGESFDIGLVKAAMAHATSKTRAFMSSHHLPNISAVSRGVSPFPYRESP